ncbi:unnamed protein product [Rangifer tarandus platyrhynchus]|uniref:Uncharacterized protein n=1 Tax=Rangifer tarandus platyrhynchus TaxID=3082113 RepID=A0ABN8ZH27_RANTA|nr:unnamed protein product [Rangifer tarandus platyrhynchus]
MSCPAHFGSVLQGSLADSRDSSPLATASATKNKTLFSSAEKEQVRRRSAPEPLQEERALLTGGSDVAPRPSEAARGALGNSPPALTRSHGAGDPVGCGFGGRGSGARRGVPASTRGRAAPGRGPHSGRRSPTQGPGRRPAEGPRSEPAAARAGDTARRAKAAQYHGAFTGRRAGWGAPTGRQGPGFALLVREGFLVHRARQIPTKNCGALETRSRRQARIADTAAVSDVWANFEGGAGLRREHGGEGIHSNGADASVGRRALRAAEPAEEPASARAASPAGGKFSTPGRAWALRVRGERPRVRAAAAGRELRAGASPGRQRQAVKRRSCLASGRAAPGSASL